MNTLEKHTLKFNRWKQKRMKGAASFSSDQLKEWQNEFLEMTLDWAFESGKKSAARQIRAALKTL